MFISPVSKESQASQSFLAKNNQIKSKIKSVMEHRTQVSLKNQLSSMTVAMEK